MSVHRFEETRSAHWSFYQQNGVSNSEQFYMKFITICSYVKILIIGTLCWQDWNIHQEALFQPTKDAMRDLRLFDPWRCWELLTWWLGVTWQEMWKCSSTVLWTSNLWWVNFMFLISNFHCVLSVVCFLLGNSPASEFYMPKFRNTLSVPSS